MSSATIGAPRWAHAHEKALNEVPAQADPSPAPAAETETPEPAATADPHAKPRTVTVGFNIDLFPIIASATQKAFGFAGQLQLAIDRVQFRLVGAKLRNFAFFLDDGFKNHDTVVLAFLLDFFFRDDLSGFWVTSGFEIWLNEIGNSNTPAKRIGRTRYGQLAAGTCGGSGRTSSSTLGSVCTCG